MLQRLSVLVLPALCLVVVAPAAALASPEAPAPSAAPDQVAALARSVAELQARVSDFDAYVTNGAPRVLSESPGPGHNAWLMISAALVLFMTLPGLALFYGGLVRQKNVLSVLAQCLGCAAVVTVLWWAVGYSLVFGTGGPILGGLGLTFLSGVGAAPNDAYMPWVSHSVFAMYQLMFAIITPALIVGAIAERMKYSAIMAFVVGWMLVVYFPFAHMVWGADGVMNGLGNPAAKVKAIDFAGGIVVHMTSGWSALVLCIILGRRAGFRQKPLMPHSLVLTTIGTGMLWFGWYGFNAGSAGAADGIAANAFMTTTLSGGVAALVWPALEWLIRGKPTVLGMCSGAIAGLAVITPAAGFVSATSAVVIGVVAGAVPFFAVFKLKEWLGYDDALDTFGVHGVGGTIGSLLAAVFASGDVNANLKTNLAGLLRNGLWLQQAKAIYITVLWSVIASAALAYAIKLAIGLRPDRETEEQGLDQADHGEVGYHSEA